MARQPKTDRKTVEIGRKRIPLRSLLHGKEIRDAAKSIEEFRMKMNEQEFLYGAKLYIDWKDYGTADIVARRLETDKEYEDRLERARIAAEQKRERERRAKEQEEARAAQRALRKKIDAAAAIKKLAEEAGILVDILDR
jgi:pyruvate/2-oxoglutarate dehydrogenase complex dihydrolipoamide acyltransferase (E2) component